MEFCDVKKTGNFDAGEGGRKNRVKNALFLFIFGVFFDVIFYTFVRSSPKGSLKIMSANFGN